MSAPPPSAVFLAIAGLRGPADHAAVEAAIRRCDPQARVWTDWPRGGVAVETGAPAEVLRVAVQDAGFIAGLRSPAAALAPRRSVGEIVMRAFGFALSGLVVGALAGAAAGILNLALNPICQTPGDSGGCAMGIPMLVIGSALIGVPIGLALAFIRRR